MGPLQLQHHCETASPDEGKMNADDADQSRQQENSTNTPCMTRGAVIFSSDRGTAVQYAPMAWASLPTHPSIVKDIETLIPSSPNPISKRQKKYPQPIPDNSKDEAYWEKRKKNNESAKRSRVMRRVKEQQTAMRVVELEQENVQLKAEVAMLRGELDKMRQMLISKAEYHEKRKHV